MHPNFHCDSIAPFHDDCHDLGFPVNACDSNPYFGAFGHQLPCHLGSNRQIIRGPPGPPGPIGQQGVPGTGSSH